MSERSHKEQCADASGQTGCKIIASKRPGIYTQLNNWRSILRGCSKAVVDSTVDGFLAELGLVQEIGDVLGGELDCCGLCQVNNR